MKLNNIKKVLAFTLAELMIVIGIIGLISIISIPSLIKNIQQREYKTGVKKAHTLVSESFDSMKIDVDNIYKTYTNDNIEPKHLRNIYAKYFGLKSVFPPSAYADKYYPLNNTSTNVNPDLYNGGGFLARNGMMIMIGRVPKPYETGGNALIISVDVDGPNRGDNQLGVDTFSFEIMPTDNILPIGAQSSLQAGKTSFKHIDYCKTNEASSDLNGIACSYSAVHEAEYMDTLDDRLGGQNCDGKWNKATQTCSCRLGKIWDKEKKDCICPSGYRKDDLICKKEDNPNCIRTSNGDKCCEDCDNQQFDLDEENWTCNEGTLQDQPDGTKKCSGCTDGHTPNPDGYCCPNDLPLDSNDNCSCPDNQEWVEAKKTCLQPCEDTNPNMSRDINGECQCPEGQSAIGKDCCLNQKGTGQLTKDDVSIGCNYSCTSTQKFFNDTVGDCQCRKDMQDDGNGGCVCKIPFATFNESTSTCICPQGRTLENDACVCSNGSTADDCGCDTTQGLIASTEDGQCICDTTKGFKAGTSNCQCASGKKVNDGGTCVCNTEKHFVTTATGDCVCDTANHWVTNQGSCSCDFANDFELIDGQCQCNGEIQSNGKCKRFCKNGAIYNSTNHKCECNLIDAKLSDDETECECLVIGAVINNNLGNYKCECPQGTTITGEGENRSCSAGGSCTARGQKWNGGECECQDGTIKTETGACTCPEGFFEDKIANVELGNNYEASGTSYEKLFCVNSKCNESYGVWYSEGGNIGICACGEGLEFTEGVGCQCQGIDTIPNFSATEWNLTDSGVNFSVKTTANSCTCTNTKLTYKYDETSKSYGCFIDGDYAIDNLTELENATALKGTYNFKLTTNVEETKNWTPWGTIDNPFKSSFDGGGNTITVTNIEGTNNVGFFGYTQKGCSISNVNIVITGNITGVENVGALVGTNYCTIKNVTITANNIKGNYNVGGVIGVNSGNVENTTITATNVTSSLDTNATENYGTNIGGFVGMNTNGGNISYASVDRMTILADVGVMGGFVGYNEGTINTSFVNSNVSIGEDTSKGSIVGGFVGTNIEKNSLIKNCYTQASKLYGKEKVGGFVGNLEQGTINMIYTTTIPNSSSTTFLSGGFAGIIKKENKPLVTKSFYNNSVEEGIGTGDSTNLKWTLEGLGETGLKTPSNYICAGWGTEKMIWYYPLDKKATTSEEKDTYKSPQIVQQTDCSNNGNFGYTLDDKLQCIVCGYDEYFTGEGCVAIYRSGTDSECKNTVVTCNANEHYNTETKMCETCPSSATWNESTNECECPSDMVLNQDKTECICNSDSVFYEGVGCVNCSAGNATISDGECSCNTSGDIFDIDLGKCIYKCADFDGIYNDKGGSCDAMPSPLIWESSTNTAKCNQSTTAFELANDADLYWMSKCSNDVANWTKDKTFTLTSDINMKSYCSNNLFKPIQNFQGSFDGNSKTISNVTINLPDNDNVGLFDIIITTKDYSANNAIQNLTLTNFIITGKNNVGALIGYIELNAITANSTPLKNISIIAQTINNENLNGGTITSTATTDSYLGSLIGKISNTSSSLGTFMELNAGSITLQGATTTYKGGIVGGAYATSGKFKIIRSSANVTFKDGTYTDGLFTATNTITNAGGIIGYRNNTQVPTTSGITAANKNTYNCTTTASWLGGGTEITENYTNVFGCK